MFLNTISLHVLCICSELQENLIRSHAAGVGPPLSPDKVRRLLTLRINVLAKGFSGIRLETTQRLVEALNGQSLLHRAMLQLLQYLSPRS